MSWLRRLFWRRKLYDELSEEIREHLEEKIDELVANGMSREEATYAARREFGNVALTEEDSREVWRLPAMEDCLMDIRYALRMLRKNPGFSGVAIVTLSLGIAANTTVFSALNGWMLRPPINIEDPGRVVAILTTDPAAKGTGWAWDHNPVSVPDFVTWRAQNHSFEDMAASKWDDFALTGTGEPERLTGERVSPNYFDVLGASPVLGRTFLLGGEPGRASVVILSYGLWQRRFGGNPKVIGRDLYLNGQSCTVIGVMPSSFRLGFYRAQLWTPLVFSADSLLPAAREDRNLSVLARLKSGVSVAQAKAEMAALAQRSEQAYPGTSKGWGATAMLVQQYIADEFKAAMKMLMGAVIFVFFIACANITSLQLARGLDRQRELAIRVTLGASRFRLIRQLLVESLLLAFAGGVLGLLLAFWGVSALRGALNWVDYVRLMAREVTIDQNVLAYTLGISVFAAILFGLAPAFHQTALDLHSTLKEGAPTGTAAKGRSRLRSILVIAEIALALALLTGAGFYVQDFLIEIHSGYGIDPNQILTANISLSAARYQDSLQQANFFKDALGRLQTLPGVVSAGATTTMVPDDEQVVTFSIAGQPVLARPQRARADYYAVSPDYLRTIHVPLLRGRRFVPSDGPQGPPVALVNQAFVRRYFPKENPVGKHVRVDTSSSDRSDWSEIVGVVGNVSNAFEEQKDMSQIYEPYLQRPSSMMTLAVRTRSDPAAFASLLSSTIWSIDKDQPITAARTMKQVIKEHRAGLVVVNTLMGAFATLGLALAAIGVFGVIAYTVSQRTHEIGLRMALGAQAGDVLAMVVRKGIIVGACGVGIGLALAAPLMWLRVIENAGSATTLDQRAPILLVAALLLGLAAIIASYIPARQATRVDPIAALRHE